MKHIIMLAALLGILTTALNAQQQSTQTTEAKKFSLQEAISYAQKYNQTLKNAVLDQRIANRQVAEVRAIGLPQVNAEGRFTYTPQIPKIGIPNPFPGPGAPEILEFPQGIDYSITTNITASQLLFDGGFLMGLQAAKEFEALSKFNMQRTEQETELAVVKAYCLALVTEESVKLIDANLKTLDETQKTIQATYKAGFVEKTDADRISLLHSNMTLLRKKMSDTRDVSYYLLKVQMGLAASENIVLTDDLNKLNEAAKNDADIPEKTDYNRRPEYRMISQQMRLYELDKKRHQLGYTPSLAAFAQHQENAFSTELGPLFNKFYPGTLVGLTLTVPIFDGLGKSTRIQQARIRIEQAQNSRSQLESVIEMEVFRSKTDYLRTREQLDVQKKNMELADDIHKRVNTKYQNGLSSSLDVVTADNDLKTAQTNYLQAIYDLLVAKAELKKAIGQ